MTALFGPAPHRLLMLQFSPKCDLLDDLRVFCDKFVARVVHSATTGQHVAMIVHELVENAVRYGEDQELTLRIERCEGSVVVCVANAATEERVGRLRQIMKELSNLPPAEAYSRALRRSITVPRVPSASRGIGLPRIMYEGEAELQLYVAPGRVSLMARRSA